MKAAYFNPFAGISGDMCLGALVDAGCPPDAIREPLRALNIPGFDIQWETAKKGPLVGTKANVIVEEEPHCHRKLADVLGIVDRGLFPNKVREQIEAVFTTLAKAEGRVHGKPYDQIHFHEVGSFDAIVDIGGTLLGLHHLGIEHVFCSKIHVGDGFVTGTRHGTLPLPAPATSILLEGMEIFSSGIEKELVTPTGAAIVQTLAGCSSFLPSMRLDAIGYGAGSRDMKPLPNLLRLYIGEMDAASESDKVSIIETNIDDMIPEHFDALMETLFAQGALDVTLTGVMMKKNRPGTMLTVISPPTLAEPLAQAVLQHSTAIGVRYYECQRRVLQRKACTVKTPWGPVRGKVCWGHGIEKRFTPEYDDCKAIHLKQSIPLSTIYHEAVNAYQRGDMEPKA